MRAPSSLGHRQLLRGDAGAATHRLGRERRPSSRRRRAAHAPRPAPSSSSATRSENARSPPSVGGRLAHRSRVGVRRPGHQAVRVVDPEAAVLPRPRGQRHQPAQPLATVLAALVEGVGRDPHRVDEPDARAASARRNRRGRPRARRFSHQRQPGPVRLDAGHVLAPRPGHGTAVEEVELEVVDAEVDQAARTSPRAGRGTPGWVRSRPTRSSPQLCPAGPMSQSGCRARGPVARRRGTAPARARRAGRCRGCRRPAAGSDPNRRLDASPSPSPRLQPSSTCTTSTGRSCSSIAREVLEHVAGGDLLEVAVPGAPHASAASPRPDAGRTAEPLAVRRRAPAPASCGRWHASTGPVGAARRPGRRRRSRAGWARRPGRWRRSCGPARRCRGRPTSSPSPCTPSAATGVPGRNRMRCCHSSSGPRPRRAPAGYQVAGLQLCHPSA